MKSLHRNLSLSPPQILVSGFALIIFVGAILLSLPVSSADGKAFPLIDAFFTATSATCVTGLVVVDTGTHFSVFGQIVLLLLIQVGGLGFMTMSSLFAFMLRKRITFRERLVLQQAMNQTSMEGIVRLIRKVILYSLTIEAVGAVVLTLRWSLDMRFGDAAYFGVFHAVSLFNNAGFDLFGEFKSLAEYAADPVINIMAMFLIFTGGIGFVVLAEIVDWSRYRKKLSLHSKVALTTTVFLILFGAIVLFIFEFSNAKTSGQLNWSGKILSAFFQSVSSRTAGANTLNIADMRQASQFFLILLMFIGASPGSTGGGIKTTTFAALIAAMIAMFRGKEDVVLFRFRLGKDRIYKALTITLFSLFLIILGAMVLSTTEDHQFLMILFEATSAFSTVGLSMGLTPTLTVFGKIIIMLMMFIGRLGPLTMVYALNKKTPKELYRHPEGKIIIG
ncbi:MAG TPA: TrkH family potassium uptake protein [Bacilli bacterium]